MKRKTVAVEERSIQEAESVKYRVPASAPVIEVFDYDFYARPLRMLDGGIPVALKRQKGTFTAILGDNGAQPVVFNERGQRIHVTDIREYTPQEVQNRSMFRSLCGMLFFNTMAVLASGFANFGLFTFSYGGLGFLGTGLVLAGVSFGRVIKSVSHSSILMDEAYYQWCELNGDYSRYYRHFIL